MNPDLIKIEKQIEIHHKIELILFSFAVIFNLLAIFSSSLACCIAFIVFALVIPFNFEKLSSLKLEKNKIISKNKTL